MLPAPETLSPWAEASAETLAAGFPDSSPRVSRTLSLIERQPQKCPRLLPPLGRSQDQGRTKKGKAAGPSLLSLSSGLLRAHGAFWGGR